MGRPDYTETPGRAGHRAVVSSGPMRSLPEVLRQAGSKNAEEIILAAGQRLTLQTSGGATEIGDVWSESDLFDALTDVLGPEQQAELAVGQVVEFSLQENGVGWRLITEPGTDGVTVRGRASSSGPIESSAAGERDEGVSLDLPALEPFHPEREIAPPPRRTPRSTRFDIGVDYGPPADDGAETPSGSPLPPLPPSAGVPLEVGPVASTPPIPTGHGYLPTLTQTPAIATRGSLRELLAKIPEGTLCFWRDVSATEDIVVAIAGASEVVDESSLDAVLALGLDELPDAWWVVRLEDPSRCLGFLLRRVEEGARVLVETRARDGAGAQRILLGVGATASAGAWLGVQRRRLLTRESDGWHLTDL